ncbi:MAG: hypothetical protein MJ093_08225 [Saccharofermentans sp.]|nr:hypothetical protein [Saccharofermentans sp.]
MKKVKKSSRHGAITVFLSIVLSAIILVECTYVILVANLDRGMTLRRAVDLQVETYMAQYNRQLLKTYGIYAFCMDNLDDNVFRDVMEANGLSDGEVLFVSGMETFDTDDLRKSISMYYAYRATGIMFQSNKDGIAALIDEVDDTGVFRQFQKFLKSDAADILMNILDGAVSVSETLESAADTFDMDEIASSLHKFNRLMKSLSDVFDNPYFMSSGFDTDDLGFGLDAYDFMEDMFDSTGEFIDDYLFHPVAVNYAAYNFDCRLEDDAALDGTSFDVFHTRNKSDIEYILTGETGSTGRDITSTYIYMVLLVKNVIDVNNDSELKATIQGIAEVLAIIIDVVSAGTIVLPAKVYEAVIVVIYALIEADSDLEDILDGDTVTFEVNDSISFDLGYREFVSVFMFFVPDDVLLDRMTEIINRDFENYVVGITVVGSCDSCSEYEQSRRYMLYE